MMNQQWESKKNELADLEQDLTKFQTLLESNEKNVAEAKRKRLEPTTIVELQGKVVAVQKLVFDQREAIETVKKEVRTLEASSRRDTLYQQARDHAKRISEIKDATTQTLKALESVVAPFKDTLFQHWQEWKDERSSYFEVYYQIKQQVKLEASTEAERMAELELLLGIGEDMRFSANFASGYGGYNKELYMGDLHPLEYHLNMLAGLWFNPAQTHLNLLEVQGGKLG